MQKILSIIICLLWVNTPIWGATTQTTFQQISYIHTDAKRVYIYKDGMAYRGAVWSTDGKSIQLQTNEYGMVNKIIMYHPNGKPCLEAVITRDGNFRNPIHYDINGYRLDGETWEDEYEDYFMKIWYMIPEKLRGSLF